jgi:hypothetical protein
MHRLPSRSALVRFRLAAWFFVVAVILLAGSLGYLAYSVFLGHKQHILIASGLLAAGVFCLIFQWISASRARCPLCLTPSMAKKNCSKNRNAQRFLGSYRLKVASSIILHNNFRCPYCNEPTVLEVRQRRTQ